MRVYSAGGLIKSFYTILSNLDIFCGSIKKGEIPEISSSQAQELQIFATQTLIPISENFTSVSSDQFAQELESSMSLINIGELISAIIQLVANLLAIWLIVWKVRNVIQIALHSFDVLHPLIFYLNRNLAAKSSLYFNNIL